MLNKFTIVQFDVFTRDAELVSLKDGEIFTANLGNGVFRRGEVIYWSGKAWKHALESIAIGVC